jgi:hypothetical protein
MPNSEGSSPVIGRYKGTIIIPSKPQKRPRGNLACIRRDGFPNLGDVEVCVLEREKSKSYYFIAYPENPVDAVIGTAPGLIEPVVLEFARGSAKSCVDAIVHIDGCEHCLTAIPGRNDTIDVFSPYPKKSRPWPSGQPRIGQSIPCWLYYFKRGHQLSEITCYAYQAVC